MGPLAMLLSLLGAVFGRSGSDDDTSGGQNSAAPVTTGSSDALAPRPDPADPSAPVETPTATAMATAEPITIQTPTAPAQSGDGGSGGDTTPTRVADGATEVMAGRVTTLEAIGDDITDVRIISGVEHGTITVNPDNTLALVMTLSDFTGQQSFTYETTDGNGTVTTHEVALNVVPGIQQAGWGTGSTHYMLATDEDGRVIVEHGENHVKVHITGSNNALTVADIARAEGVSQDDVDGAFLLAHGYGQTEDLALDETAGKLLWSEVTPNDSDTSNWLLFERGYSYDKETIWIVQGGESELHPLYFGAWGEGEPPVIVNGFPSNGARPDVSNIVIQGLEINGQGFLQAHNVIIDNVEFTDQFNFQDGSGITLRDSYIHHVSDPTASWKQGAYFADNDGVLVEGTIFDHNGWTDDGTDVSDKFSHNLYFNRDNTDVTLRDSITMRAAAWGAHVRSGGFIEDNVFLDNNAGVDFVGGNYFEEGPEGNYTLFTDNVVTSAGYRRDGDGAFAKGVANGAYLSSLVDNIVAHLWDPNNPDEVAERESTRGNLGHEHDPYYDDTIIWNWPKWSNNFADHHLNADGLDPAALDATTIQNFTADLLSQDIATIADLGDYLAAQWNGQTDGDITADDIIQYFQDGFGISADTRITSDTLRFIPDDLGDGVRWDNRLNWSTEDLPGTIAGDSVDLGGNTVVYGGTNVIDTLDFGDGGALLFTHGKLTTTGGLTTDTDGFVDIDEAGQLWTNGDGGAGEINIEVGGGRFVNTGDIDNTNLTATGGQTILATGGAEYTVGASKTLAVSGSAAKVGFDGDGGAAILGFDDDATLLYAADDGGFGTIAEFRSGAFGDAPDVQSGINLGGTELQIDLAGLSAADGNLFTLMSSDELVGTLDEAIVDGLGARNATITIDYEADTVSLSLVAGNGQVSVETIGTETDVSAGDENLLALLMTDSDTLNAAAPINADDEEPAELLDAV